LPPKLDDEKLTAFPEFAERKIYDDREPLFARESGNQSSISLRLVRSRASLEG